MTVIDLAARRLARAVPVDDILFRHLVAQYADQARMVADLAAPVIEPFHYCEHTLAQHLKGAFLRWQVEQVKATLADRPYRDQALPIALEVTVRAFTDRMLELQGGFDPDEGDAA